MTNKVTRMHVARKRMGMTQAELAALVGVTQPRISSWETGSVDLPEKRRDHIADLLGVPAEDLTDEA